MSKIKIFVIVVIVLGVCGVFAHYAFSVSKDLKEENLIKEEFSKIMELNKDKEANKEEIDNILARTVTSGSYSKVENASKEYLRDLYNYIDNINYLVSSENVNYLSIDNIKADMGNDFSNSKQNIADTKSQISDNINKLIDILTNETVIMSYLDIAKLNDYYINFYRDLVLDNGIDAEYINNKYGYLIERLNIYEKALDFLAANKKHWSISDKISENPTIMFDNSDLMAEYQAIVAELNDTAKNIQEQ